MPQFDFSIEAFIFLSEIEIKSIDYAIYFSNS